LHRRRGGIYFSTGKEDNLLLLLLKTKIFRVALSCSTDKLAPWRGGGAYGSLTPEVLAAGSSWMMWTAKRIHGCIQP